MLWLLSQWWPLENAFRLLPQKKAVQVDITSFTSKRPDNKASPRRSYAQALPESPYEALSESNEEDEPTEETESCDSSEATPKTDNAQVS